MSQFSRDSPGFLRLAPAGCVLETQGQRVQSGWELKWCGAPCRQTVSHISQIMSWISGISI